MRNHLAGISPPRRHAVVSAVCTLLLGAVYLLPGACAQQDPPSATLGIIVTRTAGDADTVLKQLKAGMDFAILARENSIGPTASEGGSLGSLTPADLQPELRDALAGIKAGEFSGVVHTQDGYAILTIFLIAPKTRDLNVDRLLSMARSGAIRNSTDVSGFAESDQAFRQFQKPEDWDRDLNGPCSVRQQSYPAAIARMSKVLSREMQPGSQVWPLDLMRGHAALAQLYAYSGDMPKSIAEWKAAYKVEQDSLPDPEPFLLEALGVSYLHLSEMENGVYRESGTMDFFPPINPAAHYKLEDDSKTAVQYFLQYLQKRPNDYEVRWLLNLTYATLGGYPAQVPSQYVIPVSVFQSKENIGHFSDVAASIGLKTFSEAGGVLVDDFENNGRLDVITSSYDMCESLHYFHNNGDGTFTERTHEAGLADQKGGLDLIQGDYNNDGCMDILVLRGGWQFPMRKSLLRNNCNGTFTDVTDQSGLGKTVTQTQTAVWVDINNDGLLDLFIGNENEPARLFLNQGDGTFKDISHTAGINKTAFTKGVTAADYDNDGFVDFYVSNQAGDNFLYHNNHNNTFTEVGALAGVQGPFFSFATWFFDYDNDGWPDLFVTDYFNSIDQVVRSYLGLPTQVETLKLYRNMHNGTFQDVTQQVGLDKVFLPMGANFGDVDNDGYLDIYLGTGQPSYAALTPHTLLRNDEGSHFTDVTVSSDTGEIHKGHGIAFADLDRRGFEDILAEIGGATPGDKHTLRVFRNPGNDNDWINISLTGVKSNRFAVGARIKVTVSDDGQAPRSIYRTVGETSSFGGNPVEQHIGLGHGARILSIDTWWAATDTHQHFTDIDKNQYIAIEEFATGYTKLNRQPYTQGARTHVAAVR